MLHECKNFSAFSALGLKEGSKVFIFNEENEMTNEELGKEVYVKNLKNAGVSEEEFKERARIVVE